MIHFDILHAVLAAVLGLSLYYINRLRRELDEQEVGLFMVPQEIADYIMPHARREVKVCENLDAAGEYKKFQLAYKRLQAIFPDCPKWKLAFAIEIAVYELRRKK